MDLQLTHLRRSFYNDAIGVWQLAHILIYRHFKVVMEYV